MRTKGAKTEKECWELKIFYPDYVVKEGTYKTLKEVACDLNLSYNQLESIQINFKSDIRSMINYMQSNQLAIANTKVLNNDIFDNITYLLNNNNEKKFYNEIYNLSILYNIDIKNLLKNYFNFLIKNKSKYINIDILNIIEYIMHNPEINIEYQLLYIFYSFKNVIV